MLLSPQSQFDRFFLCRDAIHTPIFSFEKIFPDIILLSELCHLNVDLFDDIFSPQFLYRNIPPAAFEDIVLLFI